MNRIARLCLSLAALTAACSSPGPTPDGEPKPQAKSTPGSTSGDRSVQLQKARAAFASEQYHEGLAITDELLKDKPGDKTVLVLAGDGNLELAKSSTKNVDALLEDAISCYRRAKDADATDAAVLIKLAKALQMRGRFDEGKEEAMAAVTLLKSQRASSGQVAEALLAAAECELQILADARRAEMREGKDRLAPETKHLAEGVLSLANAAKAGAPGAAHLMSARAYRWCSQGFEALQELERGLHAVPGDEGLNGEYLQTYIDLGQRSECVAAYKRLLREKGKSSAILWYLGRAQQSLADDHRAQGRTDEAVAAYRDSLQSFTQYKASSPPSHASATSDAIAVVQLSLARTALDSGDVPASKRAYEQAFAASPRVTENDPSGRPLLYDSFGGTYASGLDKIGQALVAPSTREALEDGLAFYKTVVERHPDRFGFMFNNAALTARDLGNAYEKEGGLAKATPLYEQAYKWYEKAVELEKGDARIINDCGLMLVYHLKRDYPRARALFDEAVELGEGQIKQLPDDVDKATRNNVEEAVGDAYQNIAVLLLQTGESWDKAKPFCEKSVIYYPYQQRQAAALLRTNGKVDKAAPGAAPRTKGTGSAPAAPGVETALAPHEWPATEPVPQGPDKGPDKGQDKDKAAAWAKVKAEAEQKAKDGDYDAALSVLDAAEKQLRGHAPFHLQRGLYNWKLATQKVAEKGKANLIESLYSDAILQLKKAVELDNEAVEPRLALAKVYVEHGDWSEAASTAESLLSHMRSLGGASKDVARDAHLARAKAAARVYIDAKVSGKDEPKALEGARESLRELERQKALDADTLGLWVGIERWAGQKAQAVAIAAKAVAASPDSDVDLKRLVDLGLELAPQKAVDALAARTDPKGLWYLGCALFNLALDQWSSAPKEPKEPVATLAKAREAFGKSKAGNADYASSCEQWTALCLAAEGTVLLAGDDLAGAEKALLASAELRPDCVAATFGAASSAKRGILTLGGKYFQGSLGKMVALFRKAHALVKNDVDFANNLGLGARDFGQRQGGEQAQKLFEESYAAYTAACDLDPTNVRLQNDRALILLYNLKRDADKARDWLIEATKNGEQQLKDHPPQTRDERNLLEEAVGDAYQNLGFYAEAYGKNLEDAKKWYSKSTEFWAPNGRGAAKAGLERASREPGK